MKKINPLKILSAYQNLSIQKTLMTIIGKQKRLALLPIVAITFFLFVGITGFSQNAPVFTNCPGDFPAINVPSGSLGVTLNDANIPGLLGISAIDPDGVSPITYSASPSFINCFDLGSIFTITITATDVDGPAVCSYDIGIIQGPLAVCNDITVTLDNTGNWTLTAAEKTALSLGSGFCDGQSFTTTVSPNTFDATDLGAPVPVVVTITSILNESATCMANVTVVAGCNSPTITCPANNLNLPPGCNPAVPAPDINLPVVSDGCGTVTVTHQQDVTVVAGCTHTLTRTYRATDSNGAFADCSQTFTFTVDTDGPVLDFLPADMTVACDVNPATPLLSATDVCGGSTVVSFNEVNNVDPCNGGTITRTFSSSDDCGNTTTHIQTITVSPPPPPTISCPADQVVSCFEDINADPNLATATSLCGNIVAVYVKQPLITGGIPGCDGTVYTYIYKAIDDCGRVAECEQQFLIQNNAPTVNVIPGGSVFCFDDIVVSESDATVISNCEGDYTLDIIAPVIDAPLCSGSQVAYTYRVKDFCNRIVEVDRVFTIENPIGPIITSIPLNANSECGGGPNLSLFQAESVCGNEIEYSVSDPVITGTPGCSGTTIAYTYSALDDCGRLAQHTQFITIQNEGPVINCPETLQIFNCEDGDNDALISAWIASVSASASCGGSVNLTNNYNGNAGMCINNGFTNVTFTAVDACGRTSSCVGTIIMVDTEAPIIIDDPYEVLVPCNDATQGIFDSWIANQGGAEAIDGCWGDDISWSMNPSNPTLDCDGGPQAIIVEFVATDGCGNSASVSGIFNTKVHPGTINVSGQIMRENSEAVVDVEIGIQGGNAGVPDMEYTNESGTYGLPEFDYEENLMVVPAKNDDPLNGVSTHDLILLQRHILGVQNLDSPYKRIAGDINRNGEISTFDLVLLRRLILFIDEDFQDNTSWRFVDADFVFPNPENPFETAFPETHVLEGIEQEFADFIAVKIGDLNLDAELNEFTGDASDRNLEDLVFQVADKQLEAAEKYSIDFTAQNFEQINGFQFTINFDKTAIEVLDLAQANLVNLDAKNYSFNKLEDGLITLSWNHDAFVDLKSDEVIFSLLVQAKKEIQLSEVLNISSQYTKAEAYQSSHFMNIDLIFEKEKTTRTAKPVLFQNQPNPFSNESVIGFNLPEATSASLTIYDVTGQVLKTVEGGFVAGYNEVLLSKNELKTKGILYYQLKTKNEILTKSMLFID